MSRFRDAWYMKLTIVFLCFLDTFDSALIVHVLYFYLVKNYSDPLAMNHTIWSIKLHVTITTISNFIIRAMFMEKVFLLSDRNIWLTAWLMATSLGDLVVGLVITVKVFGISSFTELNNMSNLVYLTFALSTWSDISLAAALSFFLRRSKTGFEGTDSMISMLMAYTVNTGVIVAIDGTLGMITYITMPNNFIFLAFYLLLSKLYLNAYLASLNARAKLRFRNEHITSIRRSQISHCQYAVEDASPAIDKESSKLSVPMVTAHLVDTGQSMD